MADEPTPPAPPPEDRFLRGIDVAFQIRARELLPAVVSLAWIFLALTAYYIIKPIRVHELVEALLKAERK